MALLPLFQVKDATISQWQTRWKALLDPLLTHKPNLVFSKSSGNSSVDALNTLTPVNFSVSITTNGGPILVFLQPQSSSDTSVGSVPELYLSAYYNNSDHDVVINPSLGLFLERDNKVITGVAFQQEGFLTTANEPNFVVNSGIPPVFNYVDTAAKPGTHTYTMSMEIREIFTVFPDTQYFASVFNCQLVAYEIGT